MEGKKGLPHLFNDGKPSEMSNKDFYELLKWLDREEGLITVHNARINEKLDGSSQFFGLDDEGFFWEKFGSDQRFYSEEEIPDYWAGYRELFSEMKEALDDYLFDMVSGGFTQYKEVKVQIEVITAAGSHSENNYQINLVPYRKDAFESKGCLSIIQILLDGKNFAGEDTYKEEIINILSKYDYTVLDGYEIEDFSIDLSDLAMDVLYELDNYPFDEESEKFKIPLTEIEDVLDLPTRKFNQSKLKQIFADAKKEISEKILSDLRPVTGNLSENGMFEGLAITLRDGLTFKVNSPDFKAAFLKHHQDAVAKKMNKVTEAKKEPEVEKVKFDSSDSFSRAKYLISKAPLATKNIAFQQRSVKSEYNILNEIQLDTDGNITSCKYLDKDQIIELGQKICKESGLKGNIEDGTDRVWFSIEVPGSKYSIRLRKSFGGKGKAFDADTKKVYDCKTASASLCTAIEEGLITCIYNVGLNFPAGETSDSELETVTDLLLKNFHFKQDKTTATIEDKYKPDTVKATYVSWKSTILGTVKKLREITSEYLDDGDYVAIHPAVEVTGRKLNTILFKSDRMESKSKDIVQPSDIFLVKRDCVQYIKDDLYANKQSLSNFLRYDESLQSEIESLQKSNFDFGSDEMYVAVSNFLLKNKLLVGISLKKLSDEEAHFDFIGDMKIWTNSPSFGAAYLVYDEANPQNNTFGDIAYFGNPTATSKYIICEPKHPEHLHLSDKYNKVKINIRTNGTKGAGGVDKAIVEISFPGMEAQGGKGTAVVKRLLNASESEYTTPLLLAEAVMGLLGDEDTFASSPVGTKNKEFVVNDVKMLTLIVAKSLKYYVESKDEDIQKWNARTCFYFKIY